MHTCNIPLVAPPPPVEGIMSAPTHEFKSRALLPSCGENNGPVSWLSPGAGTMRMYGVVS